MTSTRNVRPKPRRRPLYHSAKISEARFRRVLWYFVRDATVAETARGTGLSDNSVAGIFRKLRVFFYEAGLFTDIYGGRDPNEVDYGEPVFERDLIAFHLGRVRAKRGLNGPMTEPDYHFAESHWRFHFHVMERQRPAEPVHGMMLAHLLEIIRLSGPVGTKPVNTRIATKAILRQMDQRIAWLERNAGEFRTPAMRKELGAIRRS